MKGLLSSEVIRKIPKFIVQLEGPCMELNAQFYSTFDISSRNIRNSGEGEYRIIGKKKIFMHQSCPVHADKR